MCLALEHEDYVVQIAQNGPDALAACARQPPDLILLDIRIPGLDGVAVCTQVKQLLDGEQVPVLMVTALNNQEAITGAFGASAYADEAREGAPQAAQVADRFHLLQNLSKALRTLFEQRPHLLKLPSPVPPTLEAVATSLRAETPLLDSAPLPSSLAEKITAQLQHQQANYHAVQTLRQQGATLRSIAQQLDINMNTANKYARLPAPPAKQGRTTLKLIGHEELFCQRWNEGEHSLKTLFAELQQHGFRGSYQTVARYVTELRGPLPAEQAVAAPAAPAVRLTVTQAVRVLLLAPDQLSTEQQGQLKHLREASPLVERACTLAHQFQTIVRERRASEFPQWLKEAQASEVPGLRGFVSSLKKDLAAVTAGVTLPWSNGRPKGTLIGSSRSSVKCMAGPNSTYSSVGSCVVRLVRRFDHQNRGRTLSLRSDTFRSTRGDSAIIVTRL